jgi:hypothetical protein
MSFYWAVDLFHPPGGSAASFVFLAPSPRPSVAFGRIGNLSIDNAHHRNFPILFVYSSVEMIFLCAEQPVGVRKTRPVFPPTRCLMKFRAESVVGPQKYCH